MTVKNFIYYFDRTFKEFLGDKYWKGILIIVIIIFWPLIVFWDEVRLDEAKFVEEWIKIGIIGLIIFFILEIFNYIRLSNQVEINFKNQIQFILLNPLKRIDDYLSELEHPNATGSNDQISYISNEIRCNWDKLRLKIYSINFDDQLLIKYKERYDSIVDELDINQNEQVIRRLASKFKSVPVTENEINELKQRIGCCIRELNKIKELK